MQQYLLFEFAFGQSLVAWNDPMAARSAELRAAPTGSAALVSDTNARIRKSLSAPCTRFQTGLGCILDEP